MSRPQAADCSPLASGDPAALYMAAPAMRPLRHGNRLFAAAILDPDWSPPGRPPRQWASSLADMQPPAHLLALFALSLTSLVIMRLPPAWDQALALDWAPPGAASPG